MNESSVGKGKFRSLLYCSSELSGLRIEYKALELVSTRVLGERYFISKKPFDKLNLKNPSFCDQFVKACFWSFDICLPRAFSIWFLRLAPVASNGPRRFLYSPGQKYAVYEDEGYTDGIDDDEFTPGVVLDPFFGSGTTAEVAMKQGKDWVGIELNEDYEKISQKRLKPTIIERKTRDKASEFWS